MANTKFYEVPSSFASKLHLKYLIQLAVKSNWIDLGGSWSLCFATVASSPALFSKHRDESFAVQFMVQTDQIFSLWYSEIL